MAEPYDDLTYDPLAEAIGWYIRACSKVELWLDMCATNVFDLPYLDAVRLGVEAKARALHGVDPDLGPFVERLLYLFEIRNTLAHGIANYMHERTTIHLELQPSKKDSDYRKIRLTRAELVALGDEVREIAGLMQAELVTRMSVLFDQDDEADDIELDPEAAAEWQAGWIIDREILAQFPDVTPGQIYSMHRRPGGEHWGVFFDSVTGKPRKVRPLPGDDQPTGFNSGVRT
jgi:hypothetical protein